MNKAIIALLPLLFFTATPTTNAQEWTQWRGPGRDGAVSVKNTPTTWPEKLQRSWRVEVGEGYSSPVVAGGKAFVHGRRDPEEIVASINLADGKVLWQQSTRLTFRRTSTRSQWPRDQTRRPS